MTCISIGVCSLGCGSGGAVDACMFSDVKIGCYSKADEGSSTFPNTEVFTSDDSCFVVL